MERLQFLVGGLDHEILNDFGRDLRATSVLGIGVFIPVVIIGQVFAAMIVVFFSELMQK